ncbi:hypothetical protein OAF99_01740 [Akkermansiaceae bacterium]|nr:hypothetical protein [Akkermansiaceae bacterium]
MDVILKKLFRGFYFLLQKYGKRDLVEELVSRGFRHGERFKMLNDVIINPSHCWHITVGDDVTLAPRVHILAHDASTKTHLNYTRIGKVQIGNRVFIGASAIVLPGVTIEDDVVIGAGSVVSKNIPSGSVVIGNPAKVVLTTKEYFSRKADEIKTGPRYDERYTLRGNISEEMKLEMNESMLPFGYVE